VKVTLVRHATLLLETSVGRVLVDPMLRAAGTTPPIENTPNPRRNPLVELPLTPEEVLAGVDLCIVTHLHRDHFDDLIPLDLPILTQPESADELRARGHTDVSTSHPAIRMTRGRHGVEPEIVEAMGRVSGWVVDGVYLTGDTVLCDEVFAAISEHRPRAVVANAGGAHFEGTQAIVMTADDVSRLVERDELAVVAVHLEAINHCIEPRTSYREVGAIVPLDGDVLDL
jgi:L-ascorbate metabolism protein UlaG (beta-lactamase superfamily)